MDAVVVGVMGAVVVGGVVDVDAVVGVGILPLHVLHRYTRSGHSCFSRSL